MHTICECVRILPHCRLWSLSSLWQCNSSRNPLCADVSRAKVLRFILCLESKSGHSSFLFCVHSDSLILKSVVASGVPKLILISFSDCAKEQNTNIQWEHWWACCVQSADRYSTFIIVTQLEHKAKHWYIAAIVSLPRAAESPKQALLYTATCWYKGDEIH